MSMNILPSLGISSRTMPIGGSFDTPLLNGALFHQSTFRDLFGLKGVSFTAGLRLDYERMKMDYNSGTSLDYKVGIKGEMKRGDVVIREIEMMPETALTVNDVPATLIDPLSTTSGARSAGRLMRMTLHWSPGRTSSTSPVPST